MYLLHRAALGESWQGASSRRGHQANASCSRMIGIHRPWRKDTVTPLRSLAATVYHALHGAYGAQQQAEANRPLIEAHLGAIAGERITFYRAGFGMIACDPFNLRHAPREVSCAQGQFSCISVTCFPRFVKAVLIIPHLGCREPEAFRTSRRPSRPRGPRPQILQLKSTWPQTSYKSC